MQYGELNLKYGDRQMQRRVITMLGDYPVVASDRFSTNIVVNDREITIPRDMEKSPAGDWGSVYILSTATYVDDGTRIDAKTKETLQNLLKREYDAKKIYVKFD